MITNNYKRTMVWLRRDLRTCDNAALSEACKNSEEVCCIYIWAPEEEEPWAPGAASRWWLHHSLQGLKLELESRGIPLFVRAGDTLKILREIIRSAEIEVLYFNRLYDPKIIARDERVKVGLKKLSEEQSFELKESNASLLIDPWDGVKADGTPYRVFTAYWKSLAAKLEEREYNADLSLYSAPSKRKRLFGAKVLSLGISELGLLPQIELPQIDWASGFSQVWEPGEYGAKKNLKSFLAKALFSYEEDRDRPGVVGTSRLSPHLHFGEISIRELWRAVKVVEATLGERNRGAMSNSIEVYLRELGWREFAHHLLYYFPQTTESPLRPEFENFPWERDASALRSWQKGLTGYPIVDAGMRELWQTGWMHNRVRMIVGSFLVKHLLTPWQDGARWFWDTLVDADLASNTLGWQWVAGCGADAAPYFRVFNPVLQGQKFDAQGVYTRRWVSELESLPRNKLFAPWEMPNAEHIGYVKPVVQLDYGRKRALLAYDKLPKACK